MRGNWAFNELDPSILQFWRTPKQKPSRKWTVSQLAPVKQGKFLEKPPLPSPTSLNTWETSVSIRRLTQGLSLFPPHENSQWDCPKGSPGIQPHPCLAWSATTWLPHFSWALLPPASGGFSPLCGTALPSFYKMEHYYKKETNSSKPKAFQRSSSKPLHLVSAETPPPSLPLVGCIIFPRGGLLPIWPLLQVVKNVSLWVGREKESVWVPWKVRIFLPGTLPSTSEDQLPLGIPFFLLTSYCTCSGGCLGSSSSLLSS